MNQDAVIMALFVATSLAIFGAWEGVKTRRRIVSERMEARHRRAAAIGHRTSHPGRRPAAAGTHRDTGNAETRLLITLTVAGLVLLAVAASFAGAAR